MNPTHAAPHSLIGIDNLVELLQRSRASIYRDVKNGTFPAPLKLGRSSRWRMSDVEEYIQKLTHQRDVSSPQR